MSDPDVAGFLISPKRVAFWLGLISLAGVGVGAVTKINGWDNAIASSSAEITGLKDQDQKIVDWFKESRESDKADKEALRTEIKSLGQSVQDLAIAVKGVQTELELSRK